MLRYVLVLVALAQCVVGVPQVYLRASNYNEVPQTPDNGRLVNSYVTDGIFELLDGGTRNIHTLTAQLVASDLAKQQDQYSQALGVAQTIALTGSTATGAAGDACASANLINAYASGNPGAIRQAVANYVNVFSSYIDNIAAIAKNPSALSNISGARGNCAGGGRRYNFEGAWDKLLDRANPFQIGLLNEQYCSARRLYSAYNVESNNVAAAITAASVDPIVQIVSRNIQPISDFLRIAVAGGKTSASAANAKAAIRNGAASI